MQVKIKKLKPTAKIPEYAKFGDAGMDVYCTDFFFDDFYIQYNTGLAFEIPFGYVGMLFPRSSTTAKDLILGNCVGLLDSGYRGELSFRYKAIHEKEMTYEWAYNQAVIPIDKSLFKGGIYGVGDKIGQIMIMPYPSIEFVESENLSESERGANGYGSTGK